MDKLKQAVLFMEEDSSMADHDEPLMLKAVRSCPILSRVSNQLQASGVRRIFIAAPSRFEDRLRACFPPETDITVSDRHAALMDFLATEDWTLVLPRAAFPMEEAGVGFVYAAPGRALAETWRVKMTNSVQEAKLIPGWLPVYGPETIAELEALMERREKQASADETCADATL